VVVVIRAEGAVVSKGDRHSGEVGARESERVLFLGPEWVLGLRSACYFWGLPCRHNYSNCNHGYLHTPGSSPSVIYCDCKNQPGVPIRYILPSIHPGPEEEEEEEGGTLRFRKKIGV
jgi:hypothetical protein